MAAERDTETHYTWEGTYSRSWDTLHEDANGSLQQVITALNRKKRAVYENNAPRIQRGLIRHTYLVIDASNAMKEKELNRTYTQIAYQGVIQFIHAYFDQNPISQIGIILLQDEIAKQISPLSQNPADHINALQQLKKEAGSGDASIQNGLELAQHALDTLASHGTKEIILIFASLTSCDPGNILDTINSIADSKIITDVISMTAELQVCKILAQKTGGRYKVILNDSHFSELLMTHVVPPALSQIPLNRILRMGFPLRHTADPDMLCVCHGIRPERSLPNSESAFYTCPRCSSSVCDLPIDCPVCGLVLVSAPLLARSYHHLYPPRGYIDTSPGECYGCGVSSEAEEKLINACAGCGEKYCEDCQAFVHNGLHHCPSCLLKPGSDFAIS